MLEIKTDKMAKNKHNHNRIDFNYWVHNIKQKCSCGYITNTNPYKRGY